MSLRDYLLTRMALRQDARQRELDIEQARAARQAGEQAAYMQYGNAALQAAVQGAGKFAGAMSEADAAQKALEAEAIQASAASRALEGANAPVVGGMPVEGGETVATPEEAYKIAPYKSPVFGLLPDKLTAPSIPTSPPAVIAPDAVKRLIGGPGPNGQFPVPDPATLASIQAIADGAPVPRTPEQAKAAEAATLAALKAEENMTPGARAAADIFGTPAGTVEMPAGTKYAPTPSGSTSVTRSGTDTARDTTLVSQPDFVYKAPSTPVSSAQTPAVQPAAVSRVPTTQSSKISNLDAVQKETEANVAAAKALTDKIAASPAPIVPADTKLPAVPAEVQRAAQGPAGEALPQEPTGDKKPEGATGGEKTLVSAPPAAAVLANTDPAQDKVWTKEVLDNSVKQVQDLKLRTGLDLNKPAVAKSIEQASKVTGYTPPVYTKTARELAKEVTDQVWKTRPPGNPLTALFMRDNSALNKQIAEDKAFLIISGARTKHSAEHLDNFVKLEEINSKQAMDKRKMDLLEAQAVWNNARSDKLEVTIKKPLPATDRKDLQASRDATGKLDELKASTQRLLDKNGQLPIGAIRTMQLALANAAGIDTGTTNSAELGGRLGLAGVVGADGKVTSTVGGRVIDIKAYENAFRAIDKTKLSDDEKAFINDYEQAVQIIGKDLEGGKLTDADLQNYKKILFVTESPTAFINSLNQIGNRVANKYTNTRNVLSDSFNITNWYPEYVWEPISYEGTITESPLSDAARLSIPGRGVNRTAAAGKLLDQAMQVAPDASDAPGNQQ